MDLNIFQFVILIIGYISFIYYETYNYIIRQTDIKPKAAKPPTD